MKDSSMIKKDLVDKCLQIIEEKLTNIDGELALIQKSANEETKSSAGDKYETGRSMLMLEKEKFLSQKEQLFQQLKPLKTIDVNKRAKKVELGSIVYTSESNYFIAAGLGQIEVEKRSFLVISALAPIAQSMLNKINGESFEFNQNRLVITDIF